MREARLPLHGATLVLAAGAHDALSAKLAEEAGFDAIWASGFGISAVQAVPDANILTLTETLEAVRRIVDAVDIPVVADCDNGYGNAINVMRTTAEFERAGAAGLCIEDNDFPKRCSFYAGVRRDLVAVEEHARKVQAASAARRSPDFMVIARTEALIAGLGQEEALKRARAYEAAGADLILVHSKQKTPDEVVAFVKAWDGKAPIALVPTAYPQMTVAKVKELQKIGLLIWGNHAIRASVGAMRKIFAQIRKDGGIHGVESAIATVDDVFNLQGMGKVKSDEKRFLR